MENTYPRRHQLHTATSQQHSSTPRLIRSRSGSSTSPAVTRDSLNASLFTPSASQRFTSPRSKSTTKSRTSYKLDEEKSVISSMQKKGQENREGNNYQNTSTFAAPRLLQRGNTSPSPNPRPSFGSTKGRKSSASPSAWALSPGRSLPCTVGPELTAATVASPRGLIKSIGGGVGGVLKYFRLQKKGLTIQEEEFHQFLELRPPRWLHTKLHR